MHAAACSALARTLSEHCRVSGCCRQQPLSCPALPLARLHCTTAPIQAPFPPRRLNWLRSLQRQLGSEGLAPSAQRIFFDPLVPGFTGGLEDGVSRPLKRVHASAWAALPSSPLASTASDCCVDVLMSPPPPLPMPLAAASCCLLSAAARLDQLLGGVEHVLQVGWQGAGCEALRPSQGPEGSAAAPCC